jgi:hypothetical protein
MDTTFDLWSLPWRALQRRLGEELRAESKRAAPAHVRSRARSANGGVHDGYGNVNWLARAQDRFT